MPPLKWLKANKHDLGMLTGQDRQALEAVAACWELLTQDRTSRRGALEAVVALLPAMQAKCWPLAKELIARTLDWGDRERVWQEIEQFVAERIVLTEGDRFSFLAEDLRTMREDAKPRAELRGSA